MESAQERLRQIGVNIDLLASHEYLYKYSRISEYSDKIFTESSLWFSKPQEFNDPFDCQLQMDHSIDKEIILEFIRLTEPSMPISKRNGMVNYYLKNPEQFIANNANYLESTIHNSGVCCFSTKNDNILMWSHYANCHTGFCMEFDWKKDPSLFGFPMPVNYKEDYPFINYFKDRERFLSLVFGTKAKCWEYESEVRLFRMNESGAFKFDKRFLTGIIFGAKCSDKNIDHLQSLVHSNGFVNVQFKRAHVSKTQFRVDINNL